MIVLLPIWVYYIGLKIIIIIVCMAVLDHCGHHGGMHTLSMTTRTGRTSLRSEVALGLALPCVFLQILVTLWGLEQDGQQHELEN